MIGLVTVTWMVVVESTSDETVLVEAITLVTEDDRAFVGMSMLLDEIVDKVETDEVLEKRQEQADEIRNGNPEQCETKEGRLVEAVFSKAV